METLQSSLYTAALALWIFSAGLLRDRKKDVVFCNYFTLFLAVESAGLVFELLMAHPAVPLKALWLGLRMTTSLAVAPVLWLAVREIIEGERPSFSSVGRFNLCLMAVGAVLTLPLVATAHFGVTYYNPVRVTAAWQSRVIHGTMLGCIVIFLWQAPVFLWRCRQLLASHSNSNDGSRAQSKLNRETWLHLPLLVVMTTWILGLLRTLHCLFHAPAPQGFSLLFSAADVGVTAGAIYAIVRRLSLSPAAVYPEIDSSEVALPAASPPEIVTTIAPVPLLPLPSREPVAEMKTVAATPVPLPVAPKAVVNVTPEVKYARSSLPSAVRQRIQDKLHRALTAGKLHQDSLLSLRSLSTQIKEKPHYVSQVINQDLHSNFYQLVSQYRVEQAKVLLLETRERSVLEIALEVGFNSKSTFNTAFRRNTGMTPCEFREKRRPQQKD